MQHATPASRTRQFWRQVVKHSNLLLMLLPAFLTFLIFRYGAMLGISVAFVDYKARVGQSFFQSILSSPFVGFKHFEAFFTSMNGLQVLRNTVLISLYKILFGFPAPILLAILLNEIRNNRFKRVVQTITYLPHFISWVVLGGILRMLLSPDFGVLVPVFRALNVPVINFLGDSAYFRSLLVVSDIWVDVGWGSIIYLAALTAIDPQLYEAAVIDGASRFQRIWHITLPCLFPTIAVMLILRTGTFMDAGFDQVFNLYNNSVRSVSEILDTYVYQKGIIDSKFSFSTAVGLFKSVIGFGMVLITNQLAKAMGQEGIM
ncbi:ABC transporter permease subunit [Eubacteriales bacterium OttesenSCG-928-A19]|nr:ABC transporter permease subunit [Eubacteriales bacterium OttesenSCG-928-A19]